MTILTLKRQRRKGKMKERDIDTEIKEVWKQLSDERKKISLLYLRSLLQETPEQAVREDTAEQTSSVQGTI